MAGRTLCEKHLSHAAERQNKRRSHFASAGKCEICGSSRAERSRFCAAHNDSVRQYYRNRNSRIRENREDLAICFCGRFREPGFSTCASCRTRGQERAKHARRSRLDLGLCLTCGKTSPKPGMRCCEECSNKRSRWYSASDTRERQRVERKQDRGSVISHYGGACVCCGEVTDSFLALDHVAGAGNQHRRGINKSGSGFYRWIIDQGFPPGFQILCHNCNISKRLLNGVWLTTASP